MEQLTKINYIDEEHGLLSIDDIRRKCSKVLDQYEVNFCYLFGSYAKGKETPTSDVDLLISSNVKGIKFYGLVEELRTALKKKVDVLDINQLKDNLELTEEIFKDGCHSSCVCVIGDKRDFTLLFVGGKHVILLL